LFPKELFVITPGFEILFEMVMKTETEIRILEKAKELFEQFGYSKVTMEEIALSLAISKKTLYKNFSNKDHILKEIILKQKCEAGDFIEKLIVDDSIDFVTKLKRLMNYMAQLSEKMQNPMIQDLHKINHNMWLEIQDFRKNKAIKNFSELLKNGIDDGVFRDDIDPQVLVPAYLAAVHSVSNPSFLSTIPLTAEQVYREVAKLFFEGLFTKEGRKKYKNIEKKELNK
jgi:AcrR family transcriptional regulator